MTDDEPYDAYSPRGPARTRPGAKIREEAVDEERDPSNVAGKQLLAFCERYERLQEEKDAVGDDQKEVMAEAKAMGFDTATIRKLIKLRKMDPAERQEAEALLDLYMNAIGMA